MLKLGVLPLEVLPLEVPLPFEVLHLEVLPLHPFTLLLRLFALLLRHSIPLCSMLLLYSTFNVLFKAILYLKVLFTFLNFTSSQRFLCKNL